MINGWTVFRHIFSGKFSSAWKNKIVIAEYGIWISDDCIIYNNRIYLTFTFLKE